MIIYSLQCQMYSISQLTEGKNSKFVWFFIDKKFFQYTVFMATLLHMCVCVRERREENLVCTCVLTFICICVHASVHVIMKAFNRCWFSSVVFHHCVLTQGFLLTQNSLIWQSSRLKASSCLCPLLSASHSHFFQQIPSPLYYQVFSFSFCGN